MKDFAPRVAPDGRRRRRRAGGDGHALAGPEHDLARHRILDVAHGDRALERDDRGLAGARFEDPVGAAHRGDRGRGLHDVGGARQHEARDHPEDAGGRPQHDVLGRCLGRMQEPVERELGAGAELHHRAVDELEPEPRVVGGAHAIALEQLAADCERLGCGFAGADDAAVADQLADRADRAERLGAPAGAAPSISSASASTRARGAAAVRSSDRAVRSCRSCRRSRRRPP